MTIKLSNLIKYDLSLLRKKVFDNPLAFDSNQQLTKQAYRSFNMEGYKILRVMVFKDQCKKIASKIGAVGTIISLTNMSRLEYSENSGFSFNI